MGRLLKTISVSYSATGPVRNINQDSLFASDVDHVYIIADGVGGLKDGKTASQIAVQKMFAHIKLNSSLEDYYAHMLRATILTNQHVYEYAQSKGADHKMGTTLTALMLIDDQYYLSHIGDSRCYLLRQNNLVQLTEDQTLKEHLKKMSNEHSSGFLDSKKHILTQAVGTSDTCTPLIYQGAVNPQDLFLLCTDGFYNLFSDSELERELADSQRDLSFLVNMFSAASSDERCNDNISFIFVKINTRT